ncbi:FAD-dependent oxidoreductase [Archangium violaceum]|uniref:FAD-dependent oxidoreductase n=1 Tax=Archangium violaceum TaxID=83451 RepID=UPI00193B4E1F|nr:FAD-dependent oxidoreductase [Archangium violaceum]QRK06349.1 FAD-dependent oxidoreductase [Archangium violaceum]
MAELKEVRVPDLGSSNLTASQRRRAVPWAAVLGAVALLVAAGCKVHDPATTHVAATERRSLSCEIGIVGGGPAGTYMAYRLAPRFGAGVCLFEKEVEVGGRLRDETLGGVRVGWGARRVNDSQGYVKELARELDIELETPEPRGHLMLVKGRFGYSPDDFVDLFPGLKGPLDDDPATTREDELYALLLREKARAKAYPNFRDFVDAVAGPASSEYLRSVSRFHSDFDLAHSAANYIEILEEEMQLSSVNHYPVGGMSMFPLELAERAAARGVRIYTSEPLLSLDTAGPGPGAGYALRTPSYDVTVRKLVIAAPPSGFDFVQGPLAEEIRAQPAYQALIPLRIVVINQRWSSPWWENVDNPKREDLTGKPFRVYTTDHCVQHTEIPREPYLAGAHVLRSVYAEEPKCVAFWEDLFKKGGLPAVEAEVVRGLNLTFNTGAPGQQIAVPKPLETTFHVWPAGWYYVRSGTSMTIAEIERWSIEPLKGREDLMLVGEAWSNRPGWAIGAFRTVDTVLEARFGF